MTDLVFAFTCAALGLSNVTLWISILSPQHRFWPPPEPGTPTARLAAPLQWLSPFAIAGSFAIAPLDTGSLGAPLALRALGGLLFAAGGAFALWGYFGLGANASQGAYDGLVAKGAYRFSRNPQYVGTIACLLGHALLWSSNLGLVIWALWSAWFLAAPLAEEPWMRAHLGPAFDDYAARVPRFLGRPKEGGPHAGS